MISIFKTISGRLDRIDDFEPGCWVNLVAPTAAEVSQVADRYGIAADYLTDSLDADERARVEVEDDAIIMVVRAPMPNEKNPQVPFTTLPIGIIIAPDAIITICAAEGDLVTFLLNGKVRALDTGKRMRLAIQLLQKVALTYLSDLRAINRKSEAIERELQKSMRNKELLELFSIEKSLVYFITSLKANDIIMEKLRSSRLVHLSEDEMDLLEDAIIENRQAIGMTTIYTDILSGLMDAFASVINNNMNTVMKMLTGVTIVLMIPNIITGAYGMNIDVPLHDSPYAFMFVVGSSLLLCCLAWLLFTKKRWM
ncbi:magnesium transporter CorA family protein [Nitratidesulfovibrio vulgaris]|jgi:magnesium transporter|uniref:Transporter, CorA family n=2 Tax=Nitratidesulfovibrio vulgaris TaxID=881 RepID=Q728L9_NITV2|nr:magnesium transporter CorA family protein [Nitratidesulfovibrio vulgaris]GEB81514.1 magnesium transporter CorA [Desulfovibrio desulfuricans]HBW15170.1 magnesium transporter CorA family protein [Desulfovibrio sp.]AAS97056.1 transporter, CorA family [Nitratidesulfovibrio vulgaris str. Hildenborough]ABM27686.1 Mg2+ transporter protein, CorA family protein [Nitratidesulfovibrio vulgaris DP4]ADP87530.1 Mg2 transporter protein CorA family protein [Nitratidesulfovibrio vulgaris RCH1]